MGRLALRLAGTTGETLLLHQAATKQPDGQIRAGAVGQITDL